MICLNKFKMGIFQRKKLFEKCEDSDLMSRPAMGSQVENMILQQIF